ncbi:unnamed protein product [Rangifer tarandus platyrhynchus]|uniref:Uncharacterized protein n=1 Tax=Rangifer tarandus platyrhynchus TaxID=3082113 RepID=A0ABN8XKI9_RANTA|nr:unnamed protein product [Rangifer tarandus platyrhynchus]
MDTCVREATRADGGGVLVELRTWTQNPGDAGRGPNVENRLCEFDICTEVSVTTVAEPRGEMLGDYECIGTRCALILETLQGPQEVKSHTDCPAVVRLHLWVACVIRCEHVVQNRPPRRSVQHGASCAVSRAFFRPCCPSWSIRCCRLLFLCAGTTLEVTFSCPQCYSGMLGRSVGASEKYAFAATHACTVLNLIGIHVCFGTESLLDKAAFRSQQWLAAETAVRRTPLVRLRRRPA